MDPVPQNVPLVACVPAQPMNKQTGFAFGLLQALRKLGGQEGSHCLFGKYCCKQCLPAMLAPSHAAGSDIVKNTEAMLGLVDNVSPRRTQPVMAEARQLDMRHDTFHDRIVELAGSIHFGTRAWCGSLLAHIATAKAQNLIEPVCTVTFLAMDDTSMKIGSLGFDKPRSFPDLPNTSSFTGVIRDGIPASSSTLTVISRSQLLMTAGSREKKATCKMTQSDFQLLVVWKNVRTNTYTLLHIPLLCPLQLADHARGCVVVCQAEESMYVPLFIPLRGHFPFNIDLVCNDTASVNLIAEDNLAKGSVCRHGVLHPGSLWLLC